MKLFLLNKWPQAIVQTHEWYDGITKSWNYVRTDRRGIWNGILDFNWDQLCPVDANRRRERHEVLNKDVDDLASQWFPSTNTTTQNKQHVKFFSFLRVREAPVTSNISFHVTNERSFGWDILRTQYFNSHGNK